MPRQPSSIVKRQFFTKIGSQRDPANHKALCSDPQCKATYLWTTSTGSLRTHIRKNHRDLYCHLELCESQQTSCNNTQGSGVAATSSIDTATSLEAGPVGDTDAPMICPSPRPRKRHAEAVIDMTYADANSAEEPQACPAASAGQPLSTWRAPDSPHLTTKRVQTTSSTTGFTPAPPTWLLLKQLTFQQSLLPEIKATWRGKLAEMFSCHSLPLRLVASQQFIDILHLFRQCPTAVIPSVYELTREQDAVFEKMKLKVVQRMTSSNTHVTIAVDGWTNIRHDKVVNTR